MSNDKGGLLSSIFILMKAQGLFNIRRIIQKTILSKFNEMSIRSRNKSRCVALIDLVVLGELLYKPVPCKKVVDV